MNEMSYELIQHIQNVIDKRLKDNKQSLVSNLVGSVSHLRHLKDWLKNNFNFSDFKQNLLSFIQQNNHYFKYDFKTGFVVNNNDINSQPKSDLIDVFKPKPVNHLSDNHFITSKVVNESRVQELQLMSRYGDVMTGLIGIVSDVDEECASIQCHLDLLLDQTKCIHEFTAIPQLVHIYGQEVEALEELLHISDRLVFDIKYFNHFHQTKDISFDNNLWFVSSIYRVRHSANCFTSSPMDSFNRWQPKDHNLDSDDSDSQEVYHKLNLW